MKNMHLWENMQLLLIPLMCFYWFAVSLSSFELRYFEQIPSFITAECLSDVSERGHVSWRKVAGFLQIVDLVKRESVKLLLLTVLGGFCLPKRYAPPSTPLRTRLKKVQMGLKVDQKGLKMVFLEQNYLFFGRFVGIPPHPFTDKIRQTVFWQAPLTSQSLGS